MLPLIRSWMFLLVGNRLLQRMTTASAFVVRPFRVTSMHGRSSSASCLFATKAEGGAHENETNQRAGYRGHTEPFDEEKFTKMQKEFSDNIPKPPQKVEMAEGASEPSKGNNIAALEEHLRHQEGVFDEMSGFFGSDEATPAGLEPVLRHMTKRIVQQMKENREEGVRQRNKRNITGIPEERTPEVFELLDVGCGAGVLFPYYIQAANELGMRLHVTGVDLSLNMVQLARAKAEEALENEQAGRHDVDVVNKEFVSMILGEHYTKGDGIENEETLQHRGKYDGVVTNACFGNFFDTHALMTAMAQCLALDGVMFVTHPLGGGFVRNLNEEDPDTVPHFLPSIVEFQKLAREHPLKVLDFVEQIDLVDKDKNVNTYDLYFASAARVVHRPLKQLMRLRGKVDAGFGRGGKKLGFPTANLPSSLFSDALNDVPTGVYFGWAVIEDLTGKKKGRNKLHRAVVNVGYSPTFSGEENKEKIVEAHLMLEENETLSDFYNETMRLALSGFLRPEKKFPCFPDLVAAINNDVYCAKDALKLQPFEELRSDPFLLDLANDGIVWVGKDGGDADASWAFHDMNDALTSIQSILD